MKNLELNKIAASFLVAGIVALVISNVADFLYQPNKPLKQKGIKIEVTSDSAETNLVEAKSEVIDIPALMSKADIESGKKEIKKCVVCHSFDKGGKNRVGPNLWNIVNHDKAKHPGYSYSKAFNALSGKWTVDELFHYLQNPKKYVPGTKMAFAGIKKPQKVADVVKYLQSLK